MLLHSDPREISQFLSFLGIPACLSRVLPGPRFSLIANNKPHADFFGIPVLEEETPIDVDHLVPLLEHAGPGGAAMYIDRLTSNYIRVVESGEPLYTETDYIDGSGNVRWSQNNLLPVFAGDEVIRVFVTMSDVSDLHAENHRLEKSLSSLLESVDLQVCGDCHDIRSGDGSWESLSTFIQRDSDLAFSHGICPTCRDKYFSESAQ